MIVVLPLLTPSIASWWVGLVTPIPSGLARPLVESLEHDAVMSEHDIDAVIPPPAGGLMSYRDSVIDALGHATAYSATTTATCSRSVRLRPNNFQGDLAISGTTQRVDALSLSACTALVRAVLASICSMTFLPSAVSPGSSIG